MKYQITLFEASNHKPKINSSNVVLVFSNLPFFMIR